MSEEEDGVVEVKRDISLALEGADYLDAVEVGEALTALLSEEDVEDLAMELAKHLLRYISAEGIFFRVIQEFPLICSTEDKARVYDKAGDILYQKNKPKLAYALYSLAEAGLGVLGATGRMRMLGIDIKKYHCFQRLDCR